MRWIKFLAAVAVACGLPSLLSAQTFGSVRAEIDKALVEDGVPSIAVAVARDGRIIWEEGFGWADREKRIPATEHTMYSLASITKPVTTTGLMTLVQAGRIDLDRPIDDYLGPAKLRARVGSARGATVRRVADHTSGLPRHSHFFYMDEPYRRPSMDETILRYGNLVTAPGEAYQYSNLGYGLLDYIIERVSGQSYAEFMRREVFVPLGLTRTSVDIGPGLAPYAAARYANDGSPLPFYDVDHPGASAVYSSAHDLVRFGMFHLKNRLPDQKAILSDASIDELHRISSYLDGPGGAGYGLGWYRPRRQPSGYRPVGHSGGMPGASTILTLVPEENVAVVILANGGPKGGTDGVLAALMKELLPAWSEPPWLARDPPPPFRPVAELTGTWEGTLHTHAADLPLTVEFLRDGNVHARLGRQFPTLLSEVEFKDGWLKGFMAGDIGTEDANRHPAYSLEFNLKLRGDVLNGAIIAGAGGQRTFALTQWAELRKRTP